MSTIKFLSNKTYNGASKLFCPNYYLYFEKLRFFTVINVTTVNSVVLQFSLRVVEKVLEILNTGESAFFIPLAFASTSLTLSCVNLWNCLLYSLVTFLVKIKLNILDKIKFKNN